MICRHIDIDPDRYPMSAMQYPKIAKRNQSILRMKPTMG